MKTQKITGLMAGAVLLVNAGAAHAGVASGTYSVDAGANVLLWDLTGDYDSDVGVGGLGFSLTQKPSGAFSGTGDLNVNDDGVNLDLAAVVSGSSSGPSKSPKVSMKVFAADTDEDEGTYYIKYLDVSMSLSMEAVSAASELEGEGSGSIKYFLVNDATGKAKTGSESAGTGAVSFSLPDDVTGDWQLTLNLTPTEGKTGTKYTGTAAVVTSVGDTVDFTVTGTYSAKSDVSDLTLKGTGWGAGTSLTLVISTSGSAMNVESIKGKLFGQSLSYTAGKD